MPRVALVHDFLLDLRGAERVFAAICDAWPEADVFTAVYDEAGTEGRFAARDPQASFLQRLRPTARTFRPLLPLYPHAIESLDLRGYDVVVSSSSAWAHGVLVDPGAVHVCYCHNPFRYAWSRARGDARRPATPLTRPAAARAALALAPVGLDRRPARRRYVANSAVTAARIRRYFGRDVDGPAPAGRARALLARPGRRALPGARRADGAQAHRRRDPGVQRARAAAGGRGRRAGVAAAAAARRADGAADRPARPTARSPTCCARAQALVVTAEEEFGIAAVESLASGRPVIALRSGGVLETVTAGRDRRRSTTTATTRARSPRRSRAFDPARVDPADCVAAAQRFGVERFQERLRAIVAETVADERHAARCRSARSGGLLAAQSVTTRRRIHEDPLNLAPTRAQSA